MKNDYKSNTTKYRDDSLLGGGGPGRREKRGREAGFSRWWEVGEIGRIQNVSTKLGREPGLKGTVSGRFNPPGSDKKLYSTLSLAPQVYINGYRPAVRTKKVVCGGGGGALTLRWTNEVVFRLALISLDAKLSFYSNF